MKSNDAHQSSHFGSFPIFYQLKYAKINSWFCVGKKKKFSGREK
jgi:hypothetical protein